MQEKSPVPDPARSILNFKVKQENEAASRYLSTLKNELRVLDHI
jgi:hypothetical protein